MFTKLHRNTEHNHNSVVHGTKKPKLKSLDDIVPLHYSSKSKKLKHKLKHGKVVKSLDDVVPLNVLGKKVKGSTEKESKASSP